MLPPTPQFPATRWTLLQTLREGSADEARDALEALCRAYWFPIYVVARRTMTEHDAEDAVQGFFLSLLRRDALMQAEISRGKLRALLLTSFQNYCSQQWERQQSLKRGGALEHVGLFTLQGAESRYLKHASGNGGDVITMFNREWARAILESSLESLRLDYEERGQGVRFSQLAQHLTQSHPEISMEQSAQSVGMSFEAYRTALHRLRQQYRAKIEHELAITLETRDPNMIREELQDLFKAFS